MAENEVPCKLLDSNGDVLASGSIYLNPEQQTVTFYPSKEKADSPNLRDGTAIKTHDTIVPVEQGRKCPCEGRVHYHFEKKE